MNQADAIARNRSIDAAKRLTNLDTVVIDLKQLTVVDSAPAKLGTFMAEASDLGFAPGYWPKYVRIQEATRSLVYTIRSLDDEKATYTNARYPDIIVFND